jgi:hypothetical protein
LGIPHAQLLQTIEVALPGVDQCSALSFHRVVRIFAPRGSTFDLVVAFVAGLCLEGALLLGAVRILAPAAQQHDLLTAPGGKSAQLIAGGVEGEKFERRELGRAAGAEHALGAEIADAGGAGKTEGPRAILGDGLLGVTAALEAFACEADFALEPAFGLVQFTLGRIGVAPAVLGFFVGQRQPVGVLHDRVGLQDLQPRAAGPQRAFGSFVTAHGPRFGLLRGFQVGARLVERTAGVVEAGLRAAQAARLASGLGAGIETIALVELADGACQRFILFQLTAILLQLVERIGHIAEQIGRERGKRLGECIRQAAFVGLLGELGLTKLDQGIHERGIPSGAEMEKAFIDGAAIGRGRLENQAVISQRVLQALFRQHDALWTGEPEVEADAPIFEHEEPAVDLRSCGRSRESTAQREVLRLLVLRQTAELDPSVAHTPVVLSEQQVPRHLLAGIAVRFDA